MVNDWFFCVQYELMKNVTAGIGEGPLGLARVNLTKMLLEDGATFGVYTRVVENLSQSLAKNNVAIIELNGEDATLVRCALESAKLYFQSRLQKCCFVKLNKQAQTIRLLGCSFERHIFLWSWKVTTSYYCGHNLCGQVLLL